VSSLGVFLRNLPAIYQEHEELSSFLRPFEALLLGGKSRNAEDGPGLKESILALPDLLDPFKTGSEYLPWLASWLALTLRADLPEVTKRTLISRATFLYARRGTLQGLAELLSIVTGGKPEIIEPEIVTLTVGVQATVGSTTRLGRDLPFYFHVTLSLPSSTLRGAARATAEMLARDTIELGKPAHTYYTLELADADHQPAISSSASRRASVPPGREGSHANAPQQ
jgi:phage tail-like protein